VGVKLLAAIEAARDKRWRAIQQLYEFKMKNGADDLYEL